MKIESATREAQQQIESGLIQGGAFAVGNSGPAVALGDQCRTPQSLPMTPESRFDMASVSKTFTASACSLLILDGKLDPDSPFTKYLPEHILGKACKITVRDLAMHVSGFDNSKPYQNSDMSVFYRELFAKRPVCPRLERVQYACSNFILLGMIAERVSNMRLDKLCKERIFQPLDMRHTCWGPVDDDGHVVQFLGSTRIGAINDLTSHYCPFPIGNGSAFSTLPDMRRYATDLLERRCFPEAHYDLLFSCGYARNGARRSFGFDMGAEHRSKGLSPKTIFHSGWTGQSIYVDPETSFCAVVLTSRLGAWDKGYAGRTKIVEILKGAGSR